MTTPERSDNTPLRDKDGRELRLETLCFEVPALQSRQRIDAYLTRKVKYATRNRIQKAIGEGRIQVNGQAVRKASQNVLAGDKIEVTILRPAAEDMEAEAMALDILYEDAHLIVLNKPAGIAVHPTYKHWNGTLANGLLYHFRQSLGDMEARIKPGLIHRLDKQTSGTLVVGKDLETKRQLGQQFARREARKIYRALVWGEPKTQQGLIESNLGPSPRDRRIQQNFPYLGRQGKPARTAWHLERGLQRFALLKVELFTGRTHQIRSHLQSLGHPILGDPVYGGLKGETFFWPDQESWLPDLLQRIPRQALHASELGFRHPHTGQWMDFSAPLPADMLAALHWIQRDLGFGADII